MKIAISYKKTPDIRHTMQYSYHDGLYYMLLSLLTYNNNIPFSLNFTFHYLKMFQTYPCLTAIFHPKKLFF